MIFLNITEKFNEKYGEGHFLTKCKEKNCSLKDIKRENYLIIDGDEFKKNSAEKSVDCIIIKLKPNSEGKYRIILCELTSGKKLLSDAKEKFQSSGKLIIKALNELNESIYKIDCLLVGKIENNGKNIISKALIPSLRITGYEKPVHIQKENCGFSITELN